MLRDFQNKCSDTIIIFRTYVNSEAARALSSALKTVISYKIFVFYKVMKASKKKVDILRTKVLELESTSIYLNTFSSHSK
jgi:hypothetical protein